MLWIWLYRLGGVVFFFSSLIWCIFILRFFLCLFVWYMHIIFWVYVFCFAVVVIGVFSIIILLFYESTVVRLWNVSLVFTFGSYYVFNWGLVIPTCGQCFIYFNLDWIILSLLMLWLVGVVLCYMWYFFIFMWSKCLFHVVVLRYEVGKYLMLFCGIW